MSGVFLECFWSVLGAGGPRRHLRDFFGTSGPEGPRDLCKGQTGSQVNLHFWRLKLSLGVPIRKLGWGPQRGGVLWVSPKRCLVLALVFTAPEGGTSAKQEAAPECF